MTDRQIWFLTGSQGLYGDDVLAQVAAQSQPGLRRPGRPRRHRRRGRRQARAHRRGRDAPDACSTPPPTTASSGVIAWMHTFSPAKMWIGGARRAAQAAAAPAHPGRPRPALVDHRHGLHEPQPGRPRRPGVRLHPDPDAAAARSTVAGHVSDPVVLQRVAEWSRAATAAAALRTMRVVRFGDNMRDVAVTEGDKVEAEIRLGVSVNTYGVNDLVAVVDAVDDADGRRAGRGVRGHLRRRARAAPRRRAARVAALRRPHRGRPAPVPRGRRLHGLHLQLRGPRRAAPAARPGRAAADGRRLRLRRRGRLEDLGARAHPEGDGPGPARRHVLHGGLHLRPRPRQRAGARARTCSRSARP